jgi:hypothetical protein
MALTMALTMALGRGTASAARCVDPGSRWQVRGGRYEVARREVARREVARARSAQPTAVEGVQALRESEKKNCSWFMEL